MNRMVKTDLTRLSQGTKIEESENIDGWRGVNEVAMISYELLKVKKINI